MRFRAVPEARKSFLDHQRQTREVCSVGIRLLLQFHSDDWFSKNTRRRSKRIPHLLRMNTSNHSSRAVSSLTREVKGIVLTISVKCVFEFVFRVRVGCNSGLVQVGGTGAN